MASEKRSWHVHIITAHRMTESQFTELQNVQSVAVPTIGELRSWTEHVIAQAITRAFVANGKPGEVMVIPEALHFNVEISNVEEGRQL